MSRRRIEVVGILWYNGRNGAAFASDVPNDMKEEFLECVAEVLEVPQIGWADDFRAVPMWNSLTAFALVVMLSQRYGRHLVPADLQPLQSVGELAVLVGISA